MTSIVDHRKRWTLHFASEMERGDGLVKWGLSGEDELKVNVRTVKRLREKAKGSEYLARTLQKVAGTAITSGHGGQMTYSRNSQPFPSSAITYR